MSETASIQLKPMDEAAEHRVVIGRAPSRLRRVLSHLAVICAILALSLWAWKIGLQVQRWAWEATDDVRFMGDVRSAFRIGAMARDVGLVNVYDQAIQDVQLNGRLPVDYTPLRLTAVWAWAVWRESHYPYLSTWQNDWDLTRPMLIGNTIAAGVSAVLVFLLIRLWVARSCARQDSPCACRAYPGVLSGLCGGLIMWFNPAVLWNGFCWPQWDGWIMPFYFGAILLASLNWWFCAGAVAMIGAATKGQMLLAAPILLAWPIFAFRLGAAWRLLCGFSLAAALIVLPWMHLSRGAIVWCGSWLAIVLLGSGAWMIWKRRAIPQLVWCSYGIVLSAAVFLTIPMFGSSTTWFEVGFKYGAQKFEHMLAGNGMYNLPHIQEVYLSRMGFEPWTTINDPVHVPWVDYTMTFRTVCVALASGCIVLCGIAAAMHARKSRPDSRFLLAMVIPWISSVMFLPQMHGRYFIWAAAVCSLLPAVGVGVTLLGGFVILVGLMSVVQNQYVFRRQYDPQLLDALEGVDPNPGIVLLLILFIFLYILLAPQRASGQKLG